MDYKILLFVVFGILPSLTWLAYYLKKDLHPEPKKMIIKIFLWGAAITLPLFFLQVALAYLLNKIELSTLLTALIYWFFVIAFTEEIFKYLVVKFKVLNSYNLDEPLDIMLYMVVSALGFAALENVLYLITPTDQISFSDIVSRTVVVSIIRFIGATFLHTLCSAVIGYFIAISVYNGKKIYFVYGLAIATLLHGLYDFSIITLEGPAKIAIPVAVLMTLAYFIIAGFEKLKKKKGICILKQTDTD